MDQSKMSRAQQQPSIRSFFAPRPPPPAPNYAAPPSGARGAPPKTTDVNKSAVTSNSATTSPQDESIHRLPSPRASTGPSVTLPARLPVLPSPPSLPSQATIIPVVEAHIAALRRINSLLLPVHYPDTFYARAVDPLASGLFSRTILWQDEGATEPKVVGGLVCRLEANPFVDAAGNPREYMQQKVVYGAVDGNSNGNGVAGEEEVPASHAIYIQSLTLLSPYRSLGLAAAALDHIVASAALLPAAGSTVDVRAIYAHVWTENTEGLRWYEGRGFAREGREPQRGYYFKLRPDTAWVVRRNIGPGAAIAAVNGASLKAAMGGSVPPPPGPKAASTLAEAVNLPPIVSAQPTRTTMVSGLSGPSPATTPAMSAANSRRPSPTPSGKSFQNTRPETEWNDLPEDMMASGAPGRGPPKTTGSSASSRSSSTARKKKDRAYPAAAFRA